MRLRITSPNQKPAEVPLDQRRMTVGRQPGCDVRLHDPLVSAHHAEIFADRDRMRIRDLGSTNGVFLNGVRRIEGTLRPGDHVRVGNSLLEVLDGATAVENFDREATDRTVVDPFSIKLSLDQIGEQLTSPPTQARDAEAALGQQKLALLYRLGHDVNQLEERGAWVERVARLIRETIGPERLAILAFEPPARPGAGASPAPKVLLARDWTAADPAAPVYVSPAFLAQLVEEQKAILYQQSAFEPRFRRDANVARSPTLMGAPLVVARGVIGAIYLDRARPQPFSADDLSLLGVIANQGAVMLENLRLLDETVHAAKLASLGELVAGIAHEINNPLAAVLGLAQLLIDTPDLPASAQQDGRRIVEQSLRVKRIVEKLLIFARRQGRGFEPIRVNELVEAAVEFKTYDFRQHAIRIETRLDPAAPVILGSATDVEQVLVNLLQNADQAIAPLARGGTISISTRAFDGRVEIAIADDGPGIPADVLPRIFDPFFTTKPMGEGTGLGLSISHGIVKRHGGDIRAESEPGRGARFVLTFPRADPRAVAGEATPAAAGSRGEAAPGGSSRPVRVLIVEDEEPIRAMSSTYLGRRGYEVALAAGAADARAALEKGPAFDILVTDLRLPGASGLEVYEAAVRRDQGLAGHVVFITGDVANPDAARLSEQFPGAVLPKPFDLAELEDRVRRRHRRAAAS